MREDDVQTTMPDPVHQNVAGRTLENLIEGPPHCQTAEGVQEAPVGQEVKTRQYHSR